MISCDGCLAIAEKHSVGAGFEPARYRMDKHGFKVQKYDK